MSKAKAQRRTCLSHMQVFQPPDLRRLKPPKTRPPTCEDNPMAVIIPFDPTRIGAKSASQKLDASSVRCEPLQRQTLRGTEAEHVWWLVSELAKASAESDYERLR